MVFHCSCSGTSYTWKEGVDGLRYRICVSCGKHEAQRGSRTQKQHACTHLYDSLHHQRLICGKCGYDGTIRMRTEWGGFDLDESFDDLMLFQAALNK
jgi:hypothetical protein